ncbi:MAG: hypothetical protein ACR2NM_08245 [Bythopirellula sp.]
MNATSGPRHQHQWVSMLWLLAALLLSLAILPLLEEMRSGRAMLLAGMTVILLTASLSTHV